MAQKKRKSQSLLNGALVLSVSTLLVKIIGVIYKIPISNMMGAVGRGYFDSAYNLYIPIYTISMAGLPVAVSKMVSQHVALGRYRDVRMIFACRQGCLRLRVFLARCFFSFLHILMLL